MQVNCCLWKLTSLDPSHSDSTQALLPLQGGVQSLSWQIGTQPLFICISKPLHKACQKVFWFSPLNLPFLPPVLLPRWLSGKESACNTGAIGDSGMIPGSGRSSGEGNGNPLQNSCLENPMDQRSLVGYSPWHCRVGHDWSDSAHASGLAYSLSPPLFLSEFYLCFKVWLRSRLFGVSPATYPPTNHLNLSNAATLRQQHGLSLRFFFLKSLLNFLQYCFCFMFLFLFLATGACGILALQPGMEPSPLHWRVKSSSVERQGSSLPFFITKCLCFIQSEHNTCISLSNRYSFHT